MKKLFLLSFFLYCLTLCVTSTVKAQGVGISPTGSAPAPSALLDLNGTPANNKGLLIPRLTTTEMNAITSPATSLIIFNTTTNCLMFYVGSTWQNIACGCVSAPATPASVIGQSSVCTNATGISYSIGAVTGAVSYNWTVPAGATITAGQGTAAITINFGSNNGAVSVTATNSCGTSTATTLLVSLMTVSATPGSISGNTAPAINSTGNVYSIAAVSGALSYHWSVSPTTASITSGQGSTSVSVSFPSALTTYSICVYDSNACGTSSSNCLTVTTIAARQVFSYTGANQPFVVPVGVNQVFVKLWGAGGAGGNGSNGGAGAFVSGFLNVTPGSSLTVIIGGAGIAGNITAPVAGGFGGGGASGGTNTNYFTGSGGGRSAIQISPGVDAVTAGGGGGGGSVWLNYPAYAGGGGATTGADGGDSWNGNSGPGAGKGATTSAGGAATTTGTSNSVAGASLTGSAGGGSTYGGGGGGGGYYGGSGGAGAASYNGTPTGGGGGGSSYTANLTSVTNIAGPYGSGSGPNPAPNNTDIDYVSGIGVSGSNNPPNNGGNGRVVISW